MTASKSPNRLYKDPENGRLMGVCAGFANWMGINVTAVRVLFVLFCLVWGWFLVPLVLYFVLGMVLEEKPQDLYQDAEEEQFWTEVRKRPQYTAADMKRRFRDVEDRVRRMEAYVTSKRFKLDRELRDLER